MADINMVLDEYILRANFGEERYDLLAITLKESTFEDVESCLQDFLSIQGDFNEWQLGDKALGWKPRTIRLLIARLAEDL